MFDFVAFLFADYDRIAHIAFAINHLKPFRVHVHCYHFVSVYLVRAPFVPARHEWRLGNSVFFSSYFHIPKMVHKFSCFNVSLSPRPLPPLLPRQLPDALLFLQPLPTRQLIPLLHLVVATVDQSSRPCTGLHHATIHISAHWSRKREIKQSTIYRKKACCLPAQQAFDSFS